MYSKIHSLLGPLLLGVVALAGCGGGNDSPPPTYTVGGTVTGLTGAVTLANNGSDLQTISANGPFAFANRLAGGGTFGASVTAQPANQTCTVAGGSGTVASSNVTSIAVNCVTNTFTVGGTVSGLDGSVTLTNNGGDARTLTTSGSFAFATGLTNGAAYAVAVGTQPANQRCVVTNGSGTVTGANISNVTVSCDTVKITAAIGPAGGIVSGLDGIEIIIPAGALAATATIGIERNGGTWPTPLPPDATVSDNRIYEFTPHDLVFDRPVLFRMPQSAAGNTADPAVFVASFGEGWMFQPVAVNGSFVEWERPSLSWSFVPGACASTGPPPPYWCTYSAGNAYVTATPGDAITMLSGASAVPTSPYFGFGTAGTWAVNTATLTSLRFSVVYTVPGNCGSGTVTLSKLAPTQSPRLQLVAQAAAPAPTVISASQARGRVQFDVPAQAFDGSGAASYFVKHICSAGGTSGGDWFTLVRSAAGVPGFTIGGSISGLGVAGLELRNGNREVLGVPANATVYAFLTPQGPNTAYSIKVYRQPTGASCSVQNGTGTVGSANVTNVSVTCTPTTPPTAGPLVLTANSNTSSISIVRRSSSAGALSALSTVTVGSNPSAIALTSDGRFAYVANQGAGFISGLAVDVATGSLTPISLGSPNTNNPSAVAVDAQNRLLFVTNYSSHTVSVFAINATTGAPTAVAGSPFATGNFPSAIAVHPSGNFVYVTSETGNSISMFGVNGNGVLTSLGTLANTGVGQQAIAVTPNGQFAYAANSSGSVTRLAVNPTTGVLTASGFTNSNAANAVVVHPSGSYLYVANSGSFANSSISQFSIDNSTGALTLVGQPITLPSAPRKLAIDANGAFLYATSTGGNFVSSFAIAATTGNLTAAGTASTGSGPLGVAVTP